jgi:uncharacterized phage protein (TIGR01671 family)
MKREIKFRGISVGSKAWIYGGYHLHKEIMLGVSTKEQYDNNIKSLIVLDGMSDWGLSVPINCYEVIKESIGQFTGLKDSNGIDIYEGDIVKYHDFYEGDYKEKGGIGFVQWDEEHHYIAQWSDDERYICSTWDLAKNYGGEVIGNIYENPELL